MADDPNGQYGGRNWKGANASLSYTTDTLNTINLWVDKIDQPIQLSTQKHQSRKYAMVYPRAYAPGNITVNGVCQSNAKYHELSLFLRKHQVALINSPVTDRFARLSSGNTSGFRRLLQLSIPTEGVLVRGWVDAFSVVNKGHFEPAPTYSFSFFVVFDQMSEDIGISHTIRAVYNEDDLVYVNRKKPVVSEPVRPDDRATRPTTPSEEEPIRPDDRAVRP